MKLSTVICNYNTRDELIRVLPSLQQDINDHQIIVVDNASSDGSADLVREQFPDVRLIKSGANLWYSGGNNLGFRSAEGDYVLILNADTVIPPGALATMLAYLDNHPAVGAITSRMTFADGRVQRICSRFNRYSDLLLAYTPLGMLLPWLRTRHTREMWYTEWDRNSTRAVEVAPGSCLMVRRSILAQIGGFDERLKLFFTDDDLCRRITGAGCAIHYVAEVTILHDEHASLNKVPLITTRVYFADMITYTQIYFGRIAALVLVALTWPTRTAMQLKLRWKR